jgi:anti-sigma factor RsiW
MKKFRDIEQLSSYLDGQLSSSDSARLKSRIASDPELASALNDIRAARNTLRKMPSRKAPRNFTLTRQMVGLKPPLPRLYSFFRFSTALATILLMITFAANVLMRPSHLAFSGAAPVGAPVIQGAYGLGGGGSAATEAPGAAAVAPEAPAVTEVPMAAAAPSLENAITPTQESLPTASADTAAIQPPMAKAAETVPAPQKDQPQVTPDREALVPIAWQVGLLSVGLVSLLIMLALRQSAKQKWK